MGPITVVATGPIHDLHLAAHRSVLISLPIPPSVDRLPYPGITLAMCLSRSNDPADRSHIGTAFLLSPSNRAGLLFSRCRIPLVSVYLFVPPAFVATTPLGGLRAMQKAGINTRIVEESDMKAVPRPIVSE
jgi:hypothetical protein